MGAAAAEKKDETGRAVEAVFRIERPRLVAGLARWTRDLDRAEELAQDALVAALAEWPRAGVPTKPAAWLMAVAKRRGIDAARREAMRARKHEELARDALLASVPEPGSPEEDMGDELLGLIFAACHPMLSSEARATLTLRVVGGLSVDEIARAFLASEATVAQRIVRAKKAIAKAGLRFEVPGPQDRAERLQAVLEVLYLLFNEGYAATSGEEAVRPAVAAEAQRLGRMLAALMPKEPEVLGLLALMELQASRFAARIGPGGELVPLPGQNRARWDQFLILRGLDALSRAEALSGDGPYVLQAALAACHARARRAEDTDWERIASLYDRLAAIVPSPVVRLNRAIAYGMAYGPEAGLQLLEALADEPMLRSYAPLSAARGDCLFHAGRKAEARAAFEAAAALTRNRREAAFLRGRAESCA